MTFWTYIQRCSDESYHIGQSEDLDQPIAEHQSGAIKGCASERLPVALVWSQDFPTRAGALAAELKIESWSRAQGPGVERG